MDDEKVVHDVNKTIKTFHQSIDPNLKHGTFENIISINLFEKKNSSSDTIWSGEGGRGNCWEKWSIKVNVHFAESEKETKQFRLLAEKQLRACLLYIASLNITEIYHLPFLIDDKIIHSYKIHVQNSNNSDSWTGLLKKMISDSVIPSILK